MYTCKEDKVSMKEIMKKKATTLTSQNIRVGTKIRNIKNPEWGVWKVVEKNVGKFWTIKGRSGEITLDENEFHFWELA